MRYTSLHTKNSPPSLLFKVNPLIIQFRSKCNKKIINLPYSFHDPNQYITYAWHRTFYPNLPTYLYDKYNI